MSISIIPPEILQLIADYSTHYQYLLVCRRWLNSFRPSLYEHVEIHSRRQFQKLIRTIQQNRLLGYYVKHIAFNYKIGIDRQEFEEVLPNCFPLLQTLDFNSKLWKYQRQRKDINAQWKKIQRLPTLDRIPVAQSLLGSYGHLLQHMTLSGNIVHELQSNQQFFDFFRYTPQLASLELYGRSESDSTSGYQLAELTLLDISGLHEILPKLKSLQLIQVALLNWPSSTAELRVIPTMQKFSLTYSRMAHPQSIAFVASLYPNLKEVEFSHIQWEDTNTINNQEIRSCYVYLAQHCLFLEKVHLDCLAPSANQMFFQALAENKQHLVSIKNGVVPAMTSPADLKLLAQTALKCSDVYKTRHLQVQLWRDLKAIDNIIQPISQACHHLQELELNGGKYSFSWNYGCDLSVITKHCDQLVALKLTTTRLTLGHKEKEVVHGSKLKTLILEGVHFSTEAIDSVPFLCPQLKRLELLNCVKEKDALEQKISLDLSNLALDTLLIEHLYLRPSNFMERSSIDAAILAVDYKERTARYRNRTSLDFNRTRWYHLHNTKAPSKKNVRQLKRLNEAQSRQIKRYTMKDEDWDLLEESSYRGTYRNEKYWEAVIPYGYTYVSCHSIQNLIFNKVLLF